MYGQDVAVAGEHLVLFQREAPGLDEGCVACVVQAAGAQTLPSEGLR